jgi:NADPH-dependent curcumin reductase CurA
MAADMHSPLEQNRFWRLLRYPDGSDFTSAFALEPADAAEPAEGEVLIRNEYLSLDAGTRLWMTPRTDGYQPPIPVGRPVPGLVLGRIVKSRHAAYQPGALVRAFGQWGDYSCVVPSQSGLMVLDDSVADARQHLGVLGMNAWTAYVGITEVAKTRPGETVLVSAAAGATGMLAAQIAKLMGCRVIGLAGGEAKCRFLREELRLDVALDYKAGGLDAALAGIPGGIQVYFDNVGGPLLDQVLPNMAHYGRIAVCGLIASYAGAEGAAGPRRFDQILMRRLTISGFFSPDFMHRADEINRVMRFWLDAGRITMHFDMTRGLENVPAAYRKLFVGGNIGKVLVALRH